MSVYYSDDFVTLHHGDCLDVLRSLPDASMDAVVCDPPYGLSNTDPAHVADTVVRWVNGERDYLPPVKGGFMGKAWDSFVPPVAVWDECYRVLKPGGHVLAFAGSRTHDLMTLGIRLAGFDIRDTIAWLYGSGFPKSLDVSKAIDKTAGAEREVVGRYTPPNGKAWNLERDEARATIGPVGHSDRAASLSITAPATPAAEQWQGWGTALKPAFEPVVVARKPLAGTVAANVLEFGTGGLNIDATRIGTDEDTRRPSGTPSDHIGQLKGRPRGELNTGSDLGRWPTNVVLDEEMARRLDEQSGESSSVGKPRPRGDSRAATQGATRGGTSGGFNLGNDERTDHNDSGGASRFFPTFRYEAKAPTSERPRVPRNVLRLRADLTPAQVDHVRARLAEAGVQVD